MHILQLSIMFLLKQRGNDNNCMHSKLQFIGRATHKLKCCIFAKHSLCKRIKIKFDFSASKLSLYFSTEDKMSSAL